MFDDDVTSSPPLNDLYSNSNGMVIPRPQLAASSLESNTDNNDHADASAVLTPPQERNARVRDNHHNNNIGGGRYLKSHNTFQREINRAVEPFRSTYRDYNERHRHGVSHLHM